MIKFKMDMPSLMANGPWARLHAETQKLLRDGSLKPDAEYRVYITDKKPVRTTAQHKYYWGVIVQTLVDASGMDSEAIHDIWKRMFAGHTMQPFGGKRRKVVKSTTSMSRAEMSTYMERCIQFCAEQGLVVPCPEALTDEQNVHLVSEGVLKA